MKKAVMYGAGNIGRGFIGKVFADSGYEVCFIDVDEVLIEGFNTRGNYQVRIVSDEIDRLETVKNVRAVHAKDDRAVQEIARCDIMATAVGVNVLPYIVGNIAKGIAERIQNGGGPLDIILAENQLDVDRLMREMIYKLLDEPQCAWADENLGLVEASIGRMVPPLTEEEKKQDPLAIAVEPYAQLPVDRHAFKGVIPELVGLVPFSPFSFYIKRKLFLHNMGHAICAYLAWKKGYEYISEAIRDEWIRAQVESAMTTVVKALHNEYPEIPLCDIEANRDDLLHRFKNRALKDTVFRVAFDPIRKLRSNDRLVGAALYSLEQGEYPKPILDGIVAALKYSESRDEKAMQLQKELETGGAEFVLERYMGLSIDNEISKYVMSALK